MPVESISSVTSTTLPTAQQALPQPSSQGLTQPSYLGTSTAAPSAPAGPSDVRSAVDRQLDSLMQSERRLFGKSSSDPASTGVSSQPPQLATSSQQMLDQVTAMFQFGVQASLTANVANQSVAAINTLAKSQ